MKALFDTNMRTVEAAVIRAGLSKATREHLGDVTISPVKEYIGDEKFAVVVTGDRNSIMHIIGALADDGQECLVSAK